MSSDPPKRPTLSSRGCSRFFTARAVTRWRELVVPSTAAVTVDFLVTIDRKLAYAVRRAAGTDAYDAGVAGRNSGRGWKSDQRRIGRWLDWFARDRVPFPTEDGRDDAWVVIVPRTDDRPAWRLLGHRPTEEDLVPLSVDETHRLDDAAAAAIAARSEIANDLRPLPPQLVGLPVELDHRRRRRVRFLNPFLDPTFAPDYDPVPGDDGTDPNLVAPMLDPILNPVLRSDGDYPEDGSDLVVCERESDPDPLLSTSRPSGNSIERGFTP